MVMYVDLPYLVICANEKVVRFCLLVLYTYNYIFVYLVDLNKPCVHWWIVGLSVIYWNNIL